MSELVLHLDSAYFSFIFLIVSELVIIKIVVYAHTKSVEGTIKKNLDDGKRVDIYMKDIGPLSVNTGMEKFGVCKLLVPAILILGFFSCAELGISGRSIPTYSNVDTFQMGGYYSLDYIFNDVGDSSIYNLREKCIRFTDSDEAIGDIMFVKYHMEEYSFVIDDYVCSGNDDIFVYPGISGQDGPITSCNYTIGYSIKLVYSYANRTDFSDYFFGEHYDVDIYKGTINSIYEGCPSTLESYFVIDSKDDDSYGIIINTSIIDDGEKWTKKSFDKESWFSRESVIDFKNDNEEIECKDSCLESVLEWSILESTSKSEFFYIWYAGLKYELYYTNVPNCTISKQSENILDFFDIDYQGGGWIDGDLGFTRTTCDDAVSKRDILDGGVEDVTVVSYWSIWFVVIGCIGAIVYYLWARIRVGDGYDLLSHGGLSKLCYLDSNPGKEWVDNSPLSVFLVNDRVTCKINEV